MRPPRPPLFLAPGRYRRRRLMDAARMLPVAGAFLFLLPMFWRPSANGHNTALEGLYLFGVWAVLILAARLFAPPLVSAVDDPGFSADDEPEQYGRGGGG